MQNKRYLKVIVPIGVLAIIFAIPFSLHSYANNLKTTSTLTPKVETQSDVSVAKSSLVNESPKQQFEDVIPETLLVDVKGSDFEQDKRIAPSSAYEEKINGVDTQVVTGHFRTFDSEGGGKLILDDKQDGVIAVWIREDGKWKIDYNVYHTPQKHGELKIVSVKDKNLFSLVAADGTKYTFDLKSRLITQVQ